MKEPERLSQRAIILFLLACASLFASEPGKSGTSRKGDETVIITGGTLIDVRTGELLKDAVVVVQGNRIKEVGKPDEVRVPSEAKHIDAKGKWIIPGLTDMHVHITVPDAPLWLYLANGVTTIRDAGGNVNILRLRRDNLDAGTLVGPRLFFAGMILDDKPVSAPTISLIVDTPERAEEVVAFLAGQGASFIKVYNSLKEDQLKAVIKAAHARGLPVAGHIPRLITMTRAVELGMDCLEHILVTGRDLLSSEEANKIEFLPVGKREALLWQRYDLNSENLRSLVSLLAERKVFLDPTLTIDEAVAVGDHTMALRDPNNRFLSKALFDRLSIQPDAFKIPVELKEQAASSFIKREKFVKKLNDAGVRLLAGTDGPGLGTLVPGFGLHHELKLLVESGLTPLQAIQTTTINAASALRKDTELGAVEPGKLADLVILDANPLQDINNISRIQLVMKDGRIYYPALLFPAKTN